MFSLAIIIRPIFYKEKKGGKTTLESIKPSKGYQLCISDATGFYKHVEERGTLGLLPELYLLFGQFRCMCLEAPQP